MKTYDSDSGPTGGRPNVAASIPATPALQIGSLIPDIWADSTHGAIQLHRWAAGFFTMIFGHPSAYSPLSERDVVTLAGAQARFAARNCRVLGISQSDPVTERAWVDALRNGCNHRRNAPVSGAMIRTRWTE